METIHHTSNCLQFNSGFESGNLDLAFKITQYSYDLFMRVDPNTQGHLCWYIILTFYDIFINRFYFEI